MRVVVLCGGKSRRMGEDKARLKVNNRTFLECIVERLQHEFEVCVACGIRDYSDLTEAPQVRDVYEEAGPLAGMHAAMSAYEDELFFVMPVDCLNIDTALVKRLHEEMREHPEYDAVVPVDRTGKKQVLVALYHRRVLPFIEEELSQGKNKVMLALNQCNILYVDMPEVELLNVNTPEEYQKL